MVRTISAGIAVEGVSRMYGGRTVTARETGATAKASGQAADGADSETPCAATLGADDAWAGGAIARYDTRARTAASTSGKLARPTGRNPVAAHNEPLHYPPRTSRDDLAPRSPDRTLTMAVRAWCRPPFYRSLPQRITATSSLCLPFVPASAESAGSWSLASVGLHASGQADTDES